MSAPLIPLLMEERAKLLKAIEVFQPFKQRGRPPATQEPLLEIMSRPHWIPDAARLEVAKIDQVLKVLGAPLGARRGRPPKNGSNGGEGVRHVSRAAEAERTAWSSAARKAASTRMKERWAAKAADAVKKTEDAGGKPGRRPWTPAQRRAAGVRMKQHWAAKAAADKVVAEAAANASKASKKNAKAKPRSRSAGA